jgi:fumarate reductase flavoprotein subunit
MNGKNDETRDTEKAKDLEADIVVIGAGSAGLSAALTAASEGAKVIVFEKMPFPGGYSLMAEGMFAAESILQAKENIGITKDEAFKRHMHSTHWIANGRLVRMFIDRSSDTINWLMQLGVEYRKIWALWPGGPRVWHLMNGGGKALIQILVQKVTEKGVHIFLETPATELIMDKKNRIAGVTARDKEGNTINVKTPVVIIAGGGFASNKEMIKKYTGLTFEIKTLIEMQQTGDHIQMAWDVGAAQKGADVLLIIPAVPGENPQSHLWAAAVQPLLWVNQSGERFCSENTAFQFPIMANALANQEDGIMYNIFDETTKKKLIEEGIHASLGVFVPAATKLDRLDDDIKRGIKEGKVFAADSLEELASKTCIDCKMMQDTVDEYNKYCKQNYDRIFSKEHRYLQVVENKKFYAVKCSLHIFTTLGGIKINHKTEVLDENFNPISGLYATGNSAGGLYGRDYDVVTSGGALGFAVTSGRIAAENGLKYIEKNRSQVTL